MNADELADFYGRIGAALWYVQYLEDVLVSFLAMKLIHERRGAGRTVSTIDAQALISDKRRITLGPLIGSCMSEKIIPPEHQPRFEAFRVERHWLVHRSLIESGDHLYTDATRNAVFSRIAEIQEEARVLKKIVVEDFESWASAHGVNLSAAENQAGAALRKLKGD
jgi:hypothetical protein